MAWGNRVRWGVVAGALLGSARPLPAQQAVLVGTVLDSASNKPLADAVVYVGSTPGEPTRKDGRFRVAVGPGAVVVVHRAGYVPRGVTLPAAGDDAGTVVLHKVKTDEDRRVVEMETLRVYPRLSGFFQRKQQFTAGFFFSPEEIAVSGARQPSEILRRAQGLRNICLADRQDAVDCGDPSKRGTTYSGFRSGEVQCAAAIWTPEGKARGALDDMLVDGILAIEVYPQPGSTPPEFAGSRCATVVVWSR